MKILSLASLAGFAILACGVALLPHAAYGQGQGATATLTGQITDASGSVIPGAKVSLTGDETGVTIESESNASGYYRFPSLRPARYTLNVEQSGFASAAIQEITLPVGQTVSVDVSLQLSAVQETVTVSAAALALNSQTSDLGSVVAEGPVQDMPLLLRDPTYFVNLVPGVTSDHRNQTSGQDRNGLSWQGRLIFSANGGMRSQTSAMVDGVDITFSNVAGINSAAIQPTPDITQEFKLITNNYSAEYGRGNSVLNIVTKSGTNEYHGTVYWFLQNDNLNANDLFLNRAGQAKAESKRNQAGFAGGGPIVKNKIWFFGDFERMFHTRPLNVFTRVPTQQEMAGDFSDLHTTAGSAINIYNPLDTFVDSGDGRTRRRQFANNVIPASMINPFGPNLLRFWGPGPSNPGLRGPNGERTEVGNLQLAETTDTSWTRGDIKIDYQLSQAHRFMGRYSESVFNLPTAIIYGTEADNDSLSNENNRNPGRNTALSWSWTASPTMLITQAFNYTFVLCDTTRVAGASGFDATSLGGPFTNPALIDFVNTYEGGLAFPRISASGYGRLGTNNTVDEPHHNFSYQIDIVKSMQDHALKFGFQGAYRDTNQRTSEGTSGSYDFSGGFTQGPDPLLPTVNTGNGLADLILGFPRGGSLNSGFTTATRSKYYAWYFQDDWRVTPRLTLNLGVRYDFELPFTDRFDRFSRLDLAAPNPLGEQSGPNTGGQTLNQYFENLVGRPLRGAVVWPSISGYSRGIDSADYSNISPRLGFAYRITDSLVMRGGFSKAYSPSLVTATVSGGGPAGNRSRTSIIGTVDGIHPNVTIDNPFPSGFLVPVYDRDGLLTLVGQRAQGGAANGTAWTPYLQQWNFGFEKQFGNRTVASLAYAGSRGRRLGCTMFRCGDQIAEADFQRAGPSVFDTVPNPFYGVITDPTSILSRPMIQRGRLLKQNPHFSSRLVGIPAWQGPNGDDFESSFESMQVGFRTSGAEGLTMQVAYTLSKNITNVDTLDSGWLGPSVRPQNTVDFRGEKSLSAEDTTHRLVTGWVYELPIGRNKRFGSDMPAAAEKILGGWQVSGIMTLSSGLPLGRLSVTPDNTGSFKDMPGVRPDLVGDPCISGGRARGDKIERYVNPSAFALPEPFHFGSAPRTLPSCRGDGWRNFDLSITKVIPIRESMNVEFRLEMFNAFNRPQLRHPNLQFGGGRFGRITSQENSPRIIQFGLKLHF